MWTVVVSLVMAVPLLFGSARAQDAASPPPLDLPRIAFVLGNGAYEAAPALPNAVNDATAIATELERLDFVVTEAIDLTLAETQSALDGFLTEARSADVALFFYSGHAFQIGDVNYLVPIDFEPLAAADTRERLIDGSALIARLDEASPVKIVILDACRDNPFPKTLNDVALRDRAGLGLARVGTSAGMLVAFATAPDAVALDGVAGGRHSPFTSALLQNLGVAGLEVRQMLTRVRADVVASTDGRQVPWDSSSLVSDFFFAAPTDEDIAALSLEDMYWRTIRSSPIAEDFAGYLRQYPDGAFADLAKARIVALSRAEEVAQLVDGQPSEALLRREAMRRVGRIPTNMIQYGLAALGYGTPKITGILDSDTRSAIRAYQASVADPQTGELTGQQTVDLLLAAASTGNSHAQTAVGYMTASATGLTRNYRVARAWLGKAAAQGNEHAYANLGTLYLNGLGVQPDREKARSLFQQAADKGVLEAEVVLRSLGPVGQRTGDGGASVK